MSPTEERLPPPDAAVWSTFRPDWGKSPTYAAFDTVTACNAVGAAYRCAGLAPPQRIVWRNGPRDLASDWLRNFDQDHVGANVSRTLRADCLRIAYDRLVSRTSRWHWEQAVRATQAEKAHTTSIAITDAILSEVHALNIGLWRSLRRRFKGREPRPSLLESGWTAFDVDNFRLSACGALREVSGAGDCCASIEGLQALSRTAGLVIPHENVCWVAAPHERLVTDDAGRLHNPSGPALRYADGMEVFAWKGVIVPEWIILHPERVTVTAIDRHPNPWIKRCMIEVMTPARYVENGGAVCVAADDTGKLWRRQWLGLGEDAWVAVEVVNGTPEPDGSLKHYFLQVPSHVRTPREAVAWTYGMTERQYSNLQVRT